MKVTLASIDPILDVPTICALLKIRVTTFYELKARGWFGSEGPALIPIRPEIDRRPRFSGEPFVQWLSDREQLRLCRAEIREAAGQ